MRGYSRYILLVIILAVSLFYCQYFFNGYLGLSDGNDYAGLARSIVRGEGFSLGHLYPLAFAFDDSIPQPDNMWAPAYPVYLAIWFLLFGHSESVLLAAIIFSVWLFIFAGYLLARRIVGEKWALLAAALVGLNQSVLSTALEGSPEPLTAALFLFALIPLIYAGIVLVIPVVIFMLGGRFKRSVIWLLSSAIVISPWLIRNYLQFGNPLFTLQAYGEFTKGMGHLNFYYYTYRSFTPMSFWYAITEFPFYVLKKFGAGILYFSWWTVVVMNFLAIIPFIFAVVRMKFLDDIEKRFVGFAVMSLALLIAVSSLDGIHLRHLINIQGILVIAATIGIVRIREFLSFGNAKYIGVAVVIILLLPYRFPSQEIELNANYFRVRGNKEVYGLIRNTTEPDAVIVSDASDAVWWYCDRRSIWIPVVYDDLKKLAGMTEVDYIYLEDTPEFVEQLSDEELLDFLVSYSIVDGSPFEWGLYENIDNSGLRP